MQQIPANRKSVEGEEILKLLDNKQLQFLKELEIQAREELIDIMDILAKRDKESIYYLSKERKSVDELIEVAQKQNFHAGRVSSYLLLDYLLTHAGKALERNMEGKEK